LSESKEISDGKSEKFDYDVGWITALHAPEFQAIQRLDVDWASNAVAGDSTEYLLGKIETTTRTLRVVAASAYQMGMPAASVLAMKIATHFRPRFIMITGIAAGVRGASGYGDILVAEQSWDYNSGKLCQDGGNKLKFAPDPKSLSLHTTLRERFSALKANRKYLDEIKSAWPGSKPTTSLELHLGPIVSGSAVIQSSRLVEIIRAQSRKVIGIEMETYGIFYAAENAPLPRPLAISIKSVCDFADEDKNDDYQLYAAFCSANYAYRFLKHELADVMHSL